MQQDETRGSPPGGAPTSGNDLAQELYTRARHAFESGQRAVARALYQQCIAMAPAHAKAHHDLGIMAAQEGEDSTAARLLERAAVLAPGDANLLNDLCFVLVRSGRSREAVELAATAVEAWPRSADAHFNLGVALEAFGQWDGAASSFRRAVDLDPALAPAWTKLADAERRLGRMTEALACIDRAVTLQPGNHGPRIMRAMIRDALGHIAAAEDDFATAAALCPPDAGSLNALGAICIDRGRFALAAEILRRAVDLAPNHAEPRGNLGLALQRAGRLREAFEAYAAAVGIDPTNVGAQCNLAGLLLEIKEYDTALATCRLVSNLDPTRVEAHVYAGIALRRLGRTAEAMAAFREALRHRPDAGEALIELCDLQLHVCEWHGLDAERAAILRQVRDATKRVPPFQVLGLTDRAADHQQAARTWAAGWRGTALPLAAYAPRPATRRNERLRIGYLSADFRTHATAMLIAELFETHDRDRFDIVGYSSGENDGSPMRQRLVSALDRFVDVRQISHDEAARRIHADGIDILIDLKGYTLEGRPEILVRRPASIQVNYLGYPGTMGAGFIDYIIADRIVAPPDHAACFDENIVRLPHCYQPNDSRRAVAPTPPTRADCGLPENGFVFCCLNGSYKFTPEFFDVWMRLLRAVPRAVLWLFAGDDLTSANLRREAATRGIDPARLVFAHKVLPEIHLARLALADLFLDTLPINAHTTASEALWAGLPVLTVMGEAFASRVAASLLHAVDLPELVTTSLPEYEALAVRLAREPGLLDGFRARLRVNRASAALFDTPRYTRNFESALLRMAERRDLGLPPAPFEVVEPA